MTKKQPTDPTADALYAFYDGEACAEQLGLVMTWAWESLQTSGMREVTRFKPDQVAHISHEQVVRWDKLINQYSELEHELLSLAKDLRGISELRPEPKTPVDTRQAPAPVQQARTQNWDSTPLTQVRPGLSPRASTRKQ